MNPPPGTSWKNWTAVCPYCSTGIFVSTGREFEIAVRSHECPGPFEDVGGAA